MLLPWRERRKSILEMKYWKNFVFLGVVIVFAGCSTPVSGSRYYSDKKNNYLVSQASGRGSMEREVFSVEEDATHRVVRGDTLNKIALAYGVSVSDIVRANGIRGNRIFSGEVLIIPQAGDKTNQDQFRRIFDFSEQTITYIVKRGDTIGKIAKRYQTTVRRIVEMNNIKNPNKIRIRQKLLIPKK